MPTFTHGAAHLYYETHGDPSGPAVLLIAPGGMKSALVRWRTAPLNPLELLAGAHLVAMDQRNAGASTAPVSADDGWHTYTADQLALMDHLGIDRFAVMGMCIGGPYVARLCLTAPERVTAAVMLQPIGLADNRDAFFTMFDAWVEGVRADHPDLTDADWRSFRANMFGGDDLFGASYDEVATIETPVLLAKGDDLYHPASVSERVAALLPNVTYLERWKEGEDRIAASRTLRRFLGV